MDNPLKGVRRRPQIINGEKVLVHPDGALLISGPYANYQIHRVVSYNAPYMLDLIDMGWYSPTPDSRRELERHVRHIVNDMCTVADVDMYTTENETYSDQND